MILMMRLSQGLMRNVIPLSSFLSFKQKLLKMYLINKRIEDLFSSTYLSSSSSNSHFLLSFSQYRIRENALSWCLCKRAISWENRITRGKNSGTFTATRKVGKHKMPIKEKNMEIFLFLCCRWPPTFIDCFIYFYYNY
jgi:hypothetical protein